MMPPPAADDTAMPTASAAASATATLAASPSPDVIVGAVDDATAAAASAADTGMDAGGTDPSPAVVASPTTEHISPFILHIRRQAADDAAPSSPAVAGGSADGATAATVYRFRHRRWHA